MIVPPTILLATFLVAAALALLEWRRPNRRHLFLRVSATLLAVAALAALGVSSFSRQTPSVPSDVAALFTPGMSAIPPGNTPGLRFALPGVWPLPPGVTLLPDAAILRRQFPALRTLHIYGDGLDAADLPALAGLRVIFHPPVPPTTPANRPAISFLHCPRDLPLGEPLVIQGRVTGLAAGQTAKLTLTAPDGAIVETATTAADMNGEGVFTLRAAALPATGRFLWHLRVGDADQPLGIAIVPPVLPRVLLLEGAPHFDTTALRRWFEAAGGTLVTRTQVGQDRFRYAAAHGAPPAPFATIDSPLLTGFDLVLMDGSALLALRPEERTALLAAIRDTGLGLLAVADDTLLPLPPEPSPLWPWTLTPIPGTGTPAEEQSVRPQWPGQTDPTDFPVPAAPFEIHLSTGQTSLLTDHQGRTLAATDLQGRGQIALTLVHDTARWQRENDPAAFADYWSHLMTRLARPPAVPTERWKLLDGDAGPVFVDHPLRLLRSGPADHPPGTAFVTSDADASTTLLALAPDPAEPTLRQALFWPRQPGWHRVAVAPGAPGLDFYVHAAASWPDLDAARRRLATALFAETSTDPAEAVTAARHMAPNRVLPPGWLYVIFFLSAGYLWTERRLTII